MSMAKANLFLIAPPRSGSTQMAGWLASHPDVTLSSIKEPNFFSEREFSKDYVERTHLNDIDPAGYVSRGVKSPHQFAVFRERAHYDWLFEGMHTPWCLDASTSYFHSDGAAARIHAYNPDARIVLLLRHPVKRSISHFGLAVRTGRAMGEINRELDEEIAGRVPKEARYLLAPSLYAKALEQWLSVFPPEQVQVLVFEQVVRDPATTLAPVCEWLGIDPAGIDLGVKEQNASAAPRFPWLNRTLQQSGVKTWLRGVLPRSLKRRIKKLYFDESRTVQPDPAFKARLESLLADDLVATLRRVPQAGDVWR